MYAKFDRLQYNADNECIYTYTLIQGMLRSVFLCFPLKFLEFLELQFEISPSPSVLIDHAFIIPICELIVLCACC